MGEKDNELIEEIHKNKISNNKKISDIDHIYGQMNIIKDALNEISHILENTHS